MVKKYKVRSFINYESPEFGLAEHEMVQSTDGTWVKLETYVDQVSMMQAQIDRLKNKIKQHKSAEERWDLFMNQLETDHPLSSKSDDEPKKHVNFLGSISKYKRVYLKANGH